MNKSGVEFFRDFFLKLSIISFIFLSVWASLIFFNLDWYLTFTSEFYKLPKVEISKMLIGWLGVFKFCFFIAPLIISITLAWMLNNFNDKNY